MSGSWSEESWRRHLPTVEDPAALVASLGDTTIPSLAQATAQRLPDKPALSVDGQAMTHGSLDAAAASAAGWFAERTRPGDRVVLVGPSSLDFVRCYLGVLRAGAVAVLANPTYTEAELAHLVRDSGAVLTVSDMREPAGAPIEPVGNPDDIAVLAYTSGTTGRPKGVPLSHRHLLTSIRSAMAAWQWSENDVLTHCLPLFHQHGLSGVHATLAAGSSARLFSRFSLDELTSSMRSASVLFAVPTIYERLASAPEAFAGLRLCVCGSAPLSAALAARLPRVPLVRYGTTESGLNVGNPLDAPRGDTVGIPLPGVHVRIVADEIQIRGPQVFNGYWNNADDPFTDDGWFRTGDLGVVEDGHLVIRGRSKELVITGGLNVYPREVELALEEHPAVVAAAVAGVPDERWGEQVTAWVVLREPADLIAHARTRLAPYKCPKQVVVVRSLPRNHMGKIARHRLRTPLRRATELGAFTEIFPLQDGIPVAVKENIDLSVMARFPGCYAIGRTRMPELALSLTTPDCVTPWRERMHAGGSSGGSAVAVAVGAARYALGTDTGGSIRVPAALCGVAGLRPTFGAVSTSCVTALAPSLDTLGPIAPTAQDCLRVFEMLGGTLTPPAEIARIGVSLDHCGPAVKQVLEEAVDALALETVDVTLPDVRAATYAIMLAEAAGLWWDRRDGLSPETIAELDKGRSTDVTAARRLVQAAREELDALLREVDAVLLPTVPVPAAPVDTKGLASTYFRFTALASATGHPAMSVPAGLADGLPVGAQVIGARQAEATVGRLGTMIESTPGGVALAEARPDLVYQTSR
ncbi:AMP-binding protein [Actinocrispum wychmicini]|uniref:Acyl-CoA synthetase (AMP-forming)/AMP-acid ligase II n=1 Tax=Actinocrispum wychmicini TaxID=1213861 RepID=A0A4R2K4S2_9PSEU|nr:AMP-binding protein [Actinocrispum wychmicini]TCO64809.1 acyl-CoA synthetase (AMP-forming)/AMP-acid ligase II [Actinocrispum wychmicini]